MAANAATLRLQKELRLIQKDPVPDIVAKPLPNNILEWHYVMLGSSGDYEGGVYHGKLLFPSAYPFKPPSILMLTPNGRFAVNQRLCLSMSDYHPESWNPMWSVASILTGLQSFFHEETPTTGSVATSAAERRLLAAASLEHNARVPLFAKLFPEVIEEQRAARRAQQPDAPPPPAPSAISAHPPWMPPPAADGVEGGPAVAPGDDAAPPVAASVPAIEAAASASSWVARAALLGGVVAVLAVPLLALAMQQTQT